MYTIDKKIAVCYSGEVRGKSHQCRENFEEFVSNKHDVFMSTWNERGGSRKDNEEYSPLLVSEKNLIEIYQPKSIQIQHIFPIDNTFENQESNDFLRNGYKSN